MLQITRCTHAQERDRKAATCTACDVRNILIRMEDTIDRRTPQLQLRLVTPSN